MSFRNIIEANDIKVNNITNANKINVNNIEATDISAIDTSTKTLTMNGALYANNTKGENGQVLASTGDGIQWTNTTGHGPWNTDSQNDLYYNGKVGIGTNNPTKTLDVNGDVRISGAIHASNGSGSDKQVLSSTGNGLKWVNEDGVGPWDTTGDNVFYDKSNGKVGIGTDEPTEKLHVNGDIKIDGGINMSGKLCLEGGTGANGQFLMSQGPNALPVWANIDSSNNGTPSIIRTSTWTDISTNNYIYYIDKNGNNNIGKVGIGIDNPTKTLDVSGNVRIYGALHDKTDSSGNNGQVLSSTGDGLEWVDEDGVGPWDTSGSHVYYNKSDGNVGIGIDNPTKTLDVSGNVRIYGALHDANDSSGNNGQVLSSTGDGLEWVDTTNHGPWTTNGSNLYYNTGNVGIGSNIPQAKLDVAGDSLINGVTVGRGPGPTDLLNTVLGKDAFKNNITGQRNIAVGYSALNLSDVTSDNIAVGYNALHNLSLSFGTNNVAVGNDALKYNNGGEKNVAIGNEVLKNTTFNNVFGNTSGSCNTAVGYGAGINNQHGRRNTFIGCGADNANANSNKANQIVIGCGALGNNDNEITLGDTHINTLRCIASTISSLSDARDKKNIIDIPYGLDLINNLQPRQFTWDIRGETENNPHQGTSRVGFIAQEVQSVLGEDNSVLNMIHSSNPEKLELSYTQLIPVLTKAVQELSSQLTAEKEKTAILESKLTTIEARLAALEAK